jgi:hypothetical protein
VLLALTASAASYTLTGRAAAQEGSTLSLVIHFAPDSRFAPERLRRAIAEELAVDVVPAAAGDAGSLGVLTVDEQGARVVVSFDSPTGRHERREIEPPVDARAAEKDIALLAMNLVRDQSAGLVSAGTPTTPPSASPAPETVSPPSSPPADSAAPTGIELGASTTIGTPIGTFGGASDIRRIFSYMASIRADAGYRVTPSLYVGAYFTYGFPSVAASCVSPSPPPPQCAVNDFAAGLRLVYEPKPASRWSWWIGWGLGFEWLSVHWNGSSRNGGPIGNILGYEFTSGVDAIGLGVSQFQIGLDYKTTPKLRLGPFIDSALGLVDLITVYSHNDPTPDETRAGGALYLWLQVGLRGSYVLAL